MRRLFQPLTSQNSNDIISVSHRGAIIIPLLSLIAILLCGNNNDSTKKPRCKSSVLFLRGFLDALARVPVAPLGYRRRVAPGPRLPRRSLAYGRFAPGAQAGLSLGRYRSRRSLCVSAAPPLFSASASIALSTTPPPRQSWRGGARKLCAYFSPCDLICHCVHHRYTGVTMVH